MRPLPSPTLYVQAAPGKVLEFRRSRRRATDAVDRSERLALRLEPGERQRWIEAAAREGYFSLSDWIRDRLNGSVSSRATRSSADHAWNTPRVLLDAIAPLGRIGLDPCSNATSIVRARVKWTVDDDGLARDWRGRGLVYVNSEYGRALPVWVKKCELEAGHGVEIVQLVPARTDTAWFNRCARAALVGLWRGRFTFSGACSPAPFPSALVYWGRRRSLFRRTISRHCTSILEPG